MIKNCFLLLSFVFFIPIPILILINALESYLIGYNVYYLKSQSQNQYCEMVKIYENDNRKNVYQKNGWPDYKKKNCK